MTAQQHMDRLSALDASFLAGEKESSHMHVGAVMIFEGPPPGHEDMLEHIAARLPLVPRYRQKLAVPRFEMGRPLWVDDPSFNLEYHVRHTALASPGDLAQLRLLTARIFSQRLDRSKPLWEVWFVQGLEGERFALISKTHHALVDGVSGVDLATVLFDLSPVPPERTEVPEWTPRPEPSQAQLVAEGIKGLLRRPVEIGRTAVDAAVHPERTLETVREAAQGLGEVAWARRSRTRSAAPSTTSCWRS
jgi:WS/DGAT/MGAT family acyltransferase